MYVGLVLLLTQCAGKQVDEKQLPLERIKLPEGFKIKIFAEVNNARSLAISPSGTVFVGNKDGDKVYAVKDTDGDFKADKKWVIDSGLNQPNGVVEVVEAPDPVDFFEHVGIDLGGIVQRVGFLANV